MKKLGFLALLFTIIVSTSGQVDAQKGGSSSKPSSSSSSRPTPSPAPSRPSPPPTPAPTPKFGPTTPSSPPKTEAAKPTTPTPKFGPTPSSPPKTEVASPSPSKGTSQKPNSSGNEKALANKQEASKKKYEEQVKASEPPKPEYKTPDGKTVKVDATSKVTETIRSKPSSYYEPEVRQTRTVEHIHTYHYSHDYNYYRSQPVFYVGGGYSSAFWYMMMDWDAQRRAAWFYHNQGRIEESAYLRGMQDAQVAAEYRKLEAQRIARNRDYVDPEFVSDPSMMLDDNYIEAAYNPRPRSQQAEEAHASNENASAVLKWICVGFCVVAGIVFLIYLITSVKVNK